MGSTINVPTTNTKSTIAKSTPSLVLREAFRYTLTPNTLGVRGVHVRPTEVFYRTPADKIALRTTLALLTSYYRSVPDKLALRDVASRVVDTRRLLSEAMALRDTPSRRVDVYRFLSQNLGLRDARSRVVDVRRAQQDGLGLRDARSRVVDVRRRPIDTLGLRTVLVLAGGTTKTWSTFDKLALSTMPLQQVLRLRQITNRLGMEGEGYALETLRSWSKSEVLGIYADVVNERVYRNRIVQSTLATQTIVLRFTQSIRKLSDGLGLRTAQTALRPWVSRAASDRLGLRTSSSQFRISNRQIAQIIGIATSIGRAVTYVRQQATNLGLYDYDYQSVRRNRSITEAIALATDEALEKFVAYVLADKLGVRDARAIEVAYKRLAFSATAFGTNTKKIADHMRAVLQSLGLRDNVVTTSSAFTYRLVETFMGLRTAAPLIRMTVKRLAATNLGLASDQDVARTIGMMLATQMVLSGLYVSHINPVPLAVDESLGFDADETAHTVRHRRLVVNLLGTATSVAKVCSAFRAVADRMGVSTSQAVNHVIPAVTHLILLAEGLSLDTATERTASYYRSVIENVGMGEEFYGFKEALLQISDSLGLRDAIASSTTYSKSVVDALAFIQAASIARTVLLKIVDRMGTEDETILGLSAMRLVADSMGIEADYSEKSVSLGFAAADRLGLGEDLGSQVDYLREKMDGLGLAATIADVAHFGVLAAALADELGLSAAVASQTDYLRQLASLVGASDETQHEATWSRLTADALAAVDDVDRLVSYHRVITAALAQVDRMLDGVTGQARRVDWGVEAAQTFVAGAVQWEVATDSA